MTPELTIRKAMAADRAAIRDCAERAFSPYIPLIGQAPAPMQADFSSQIAAGLIHVAVSAPSGLLGISETESSQSTAHFLGYATVLLNADHAELDAVAVHPGAAGRGVGKALIAHAEEQARQAGLATMRLYTNAMMQANQAIYPHLGYIEVGRRQDGGFDRVFYEKSLRAV